MYVSFKSQIMLINRNLFLLTGNTVKEKIISDINKSEYFSVLVDESTDITAHEQMVLYVKYIDQDFQTKTSFIGIVMVRNEHYLLS